jgi:hypothetical protein
MNSSKNMFFFCKHWWCLLQKIQEFLAFAKISIIISFLLHFCPKKCSEIDRTLKNKMNFLKILRTQTSTRIAFVTYTKKIFGLNEYGYSIENLY